MYPIQANLSYIYAYKLILLLLITTTAATTTTTTEDGHHHQQQQPLTAIEALKEACATLAGQCDMVLDKLMDAVPEVKEDCERMEKIREEERMNDDDEEEDDDGGEEIGEEVYEDE